jgi:hypothetical protein
MKFNAFRVVPAVPEGLLGLREIAYNLRWSWDDDLRTVFSRLDRDLWDRTYQNPVLLLGSVSQERLETLARDDSFLALYDRGLERLRSYLHEPTAWDRRWPDRPLVAYFSAEYGIAECLPIYPGGLGVLSGHHLKSASDLGVPLVAVGLLYQQGYFRQYLSSTSAAGVSWCRCGGPTWGACPSTSSTRTCPRTRPISRTSPTSSTAGTRRRGSGRRSCWGSAACAPCASSASIPRSAT